jgi:hypothetical protein
MLVSPPGRHEIRELVHEVLQSVEREPISQTVWMTGGSVLAWDYYRATLTEPHARATADGSRRAALNVMKAPWWHTEERTSQPDWGMAELRRIRAMGTPCAWMLLSIERADSSERAALHDAIRRSEARIAKSTAPTGAELLRVCFPAQPAVSIAQPSRPFP